MEKILQFFKKAPSFDIRRRKKALNKATSFAYAIIRMLILLAIGYIIIYPLLYMIVTSLRSRDSYFDSARVWIPSGIDVLFNYKMAIDATDFWNGLKQTFILEVIAGGIEIITCAIVAYGFARFKFKLKPALIVCLFLTILIPETMIIIPRVVNYAHMDFLGILGFIGDLMGTELRPNIIGTPFAFWLPSIFAMGLRSGILIYIYIQFFKGLPYELEEASWVDGAGPIRTFVSIALPSSGVVFTTVTVFSIIWHWNDNVLSSMYVSDNFPLAVQLERIEAYLNAMGYFVNNSNPDTMAFYMAACFLFILPMLIFYMILQRGFIESIDRVGITG